MGREEGTFLCVQCLKMNVIQRGAKMTPRREDPENTKPWSTGDNSTLCTYAMLASKFTADESLNKTLHKLILLQTVYVGQFTRHQTI
jgi:hypothetical protein